jgi:hypothetical protein
MPLAALGAQGREIATFRTLQTLTKHISPNESLKEIAMDTFNPRYQEFLNGPLTKEFRARLQRFRDDNGATLQDIGTELGFSGAFVSTLLNPKHPANIRTKHVAKVVQKVEEAEIELGWRKPERPTKKQEPSTMSLDDHVDAIEAMGYSVTLVRKPRQPSL